MADKNTAALPDYWFVVRPMAPLFFGQPRANVAGETHHVASRFPPPLRAWQGLLRTHLLRSVRPALDLNDFSPRARTRREALVGDARRLPADDWQIWSGLPAQWQEAEEDGAPHGWMPWLPAPAFLLKDSEDRIRFPRLIRDRHGGLPTGEPMLGRPDRDARPLGPRWCDARTLERVLAGTAADQFSLQKDFPPEPPFLHWEVKSGLALDKRNGRSATALSGMLYFMKQLRMAPGSGFLGGLAAHLGDEFDRRALARAQATWGRHGRPVDIATIDNTGDIASAWWTLLRGEHLEFPSGVGETQFFWLVTLTPVYLPDARNPTPRLEEFPDVTFRCEGVISAHPTIEGGLDLANNRPLDNRPMLPAGTSWLFRLQGGDAGSRHRALLALNNGFRLGPAEDAAFGYGHTLVGVATGVAQETKGEST